MTEELSSRGREMGASGLRSSSKQTVQKTYDNIVQSLFTPNVALELADERARPEGLAERIEGRVQCIEIVCCAGGRTLSDVLGLGDVRVLERGLVQLDRVEGELGIVGCHCCLLFGESVEGLLRRCCCWPARCETDQYSRQRQGHIRTTPSSHRVLGASLRVGDVKNATDMCKILSL